MKNKKYFILCSNTGSQSKISVAAKGLMIGTHIIYFDEHILMNILNRFINIYQ